MEEIPKLKKRKRSKAAESRPTSPLLPCECIGCDEKSRRDYLAMRFPNGEVIWDLLETEIKDKDMQDKEKKCTSKLNFQNCDRELDEDVVSDNEYNDKDGNELHNSVDNPNK